MKKKIPSVVPPVNAKRLGAQASRLLFASEAKQTRRAGEASDFLVTGASAVARAQQARRLRTQGMARCSLWWRSVPTLPQHKLGLIGQYEATDDNAAATLLNRACEQLAANGCTMAVGPMDGNTWQPYRFVTERGEEPPFFLEPNNPAAWPQHFSSNGFTPLAEYYSTMTTDLTVRDPRMDAVAERMATLGVIIRSVRLDDFATELAHLYQVSAHAFHNNFLYTPISEADFMAQYEPIKSYVQPELVLLAECDEQVLGFLFAVPDVLQAVRDTFIIKTVAVLPNERYAGLGSLLVARSHEIAASLGYKRAIHALMHEGNKSRRISQHYSQPLRRYVLFGKAL